MNANGAVPVFTVVSVRLSFIDTEIFTSTSKSCGKSARVSSFETRPSVISVISSEYELARTVNGITRAKPCCAMPGIASRPNCGQHTGMPPWNESPRL